MLANQRIERLARIFVLILCALPFVGRSAAAQTLLYDRCGTLISGIQCVTFLDDQGQNWTVNGSTAPFGINDTFRIVGTAMPGPVLNCAAADGVLTVGNVSPCNVISIPYDRCGTLISGIQCVTFIDNQGDSWTVNGSTAPFGINDQFRIVGTATPGNNPNCLAAMGSINVASVSPCAVISFPYDRCGTLISGIQCVTFIDDQGDSWTVNGSTAPFGINDQFRIVGTATPGNNPNCLAAMGSINVSSVSLCNVISFPYDRCGTLISGIQCVTFIDDQGDNWRVNGSTAPFGINDQFRIVGAATPGPVPNCAAADGVLTVSNVTPCSFAYDRCGTLISGIQCVTFIDDQGDNWTVNGSTAPFGINESFRIVGTATLGANPNCLAAIGALSNITASTCELGVDGCFGNGGDQMGCTDCPCNNNAGLPCRGGCKHSLSDALHGGCGAELRAAGSTSILFGNLGFTLHTAKANSFAVLISGSAAAPNNFANPCATQNPGSGITSFALDGLRCVVGNVTRHGSRAIDAACEVAANGVGPEGTWGPPSIPNDSVLVPGVTRHFQAIYREEAGLVCGTAQNSSQRVSIMFTP